MFLGPFWLQVSCGNYCESFVKYTGNLPIELGTFTSYMALCHFFANIFQTWKPSCMIISTFYVMWLMSKINILFFFWSFRTLSSWIPDWLMISFFFKIKFENLTVHVLLLSFFEFCLLRFHGLFEGSPENKGIHDRFSNLLHSPHRSRFEKPWQRTSPRLMTSRLAKRPMITAPRPRLTEAKRGLRYFF